MTNQEAFDKAALHLLNQGKRSTSDGVLCMYRGRDGLKCAIGALIPDELYEKRMESKTVDQLLTDKDYPRIHKLFAGLDRDLLLDLQSVHDLTDIDDESGFRMGIVRKLQRIAVMYDLNTEVIEAWFNPPLATITAEEKEPEFA